MVVVIIVLICFFLELRVKIFKGFVYKCNCVFGVGELELFVIWFCSFILGNKSWFLLVYKYKYKWFGKYSWEFLSSVFCL